MFGLKRDSRPRTFQQDLKATRKSAIRTAFLVVLLISGIVPAVTFLFGSANTSELSMKEQFSPLWDVLVHTYPLTLAIGVITYSRKQKWLGFGKWVFAASTVFLAATVSNTLSQWTGHGLIEPANVVGRYENPLLGFPAAGINFFFGFYEHYGFAPFLASILVGMFAGSAASRLSRHVPGDVESSAGLVREIVKGSKRAA